MSPTLGQTELSPVIFTLETFEVETVEGDCGGVKGKGITQETP